MTVGRDSLLDGSVLHLRLDFGKGNILDVAAIRELRQVVAEIGDRSELKALLVDHTGQHFSFGASVEDHLPDRVGEMLPEFHALVRETLALDLPMLAAVRGQCLGGGLEVALLADRIVAAPGARFAQPEINLAVFAPVASLLLPHRVGTQTATDLLLSGRSVEASEAAELGLVAEIAHDPFAAARRWAEKHLVPKSAAALRFATRAARLHWSARFLADLERVERLYLDELMETEDAVEGIEAFLERRQAEWQNR